MPSVTEPPAEEIPPRNRATTTVPKFGAKAAGSCQTGRISALQTLCDSNNAYC